MSEVIGRTAALHVAFWQYDPWYRRAWFFWPQAAAILLAGWLIADRPALWSGKWGKPVDCSNPTNPGCAATQRSLLFEFSDSLTSPTIAKHTIVTVDRSAFRSSAAADQPRLSAALGAYYRGEWAKAVAALKPAASADANVQFVTALALLVPNTTDQVRDALALLRTAAAAGHRQASVVLGRMFFIGGPGMAKDEQQGRKLIEEGAAAGDPFAMRLAGVGYLSREFGIYDLAKAVELMRKAADAGDPIAMAQFAEFLYSGRGLARDEAKALDYMRRAADAGFTFAQFRLGWWITQRYNKRETEDLSEGIKWYERAYQKGYWFDALVNLANARRLARATPWFDTQRSYALLQLCAPYAHGRCHYWLAATYRTGAGTAQDLVKAYAHYTVARQLGRQEAATDIQQLDAVLLPAAKAAATQLAGTLAANLKPVPPGIDLQIAETDAAGPSPWAPPQPAPVPPAPAPSQTPDTTADWDACKGNNHDPAIAACTRLIASGITGTDLGLAHFNKAASLHAKNQYQQAIAEFDEAIRLRANLAIAHNDRGGAYQALGNLDAAYRDFNEAVGIDPSYALGYENRAYVHMRRNRLEEAIADATTAIRLNPKRARAHSIRAWAYEEKGQWTEVVADSTTCIGLDPKFSDCLDRRGYAYDKLGKSDLALADLDESLRLAPQSAWTLVTRGNVRKDKQLVDLAMTDYTEAIRLDPKRDLAYANRADAYLIKQQYPLAIADATKAIEINPRRWFAFAVRGFALFDSGRLEEASSDLAQAVQQYPKWVKPRYWYAVAEARLEEKTYDSCPKGGNRRPDASTTVGGLPVCMKGLEFNNSLRELTEVIRLNPEHSDAYAYRGYLYIKLNQRERAISDLRRAVQINPNNTTARNNMRSLGVAP